MLDVNDHTLKIKTKKSNGFWNFECVDSGGKLFCGKSHFPPDFFSSNLILCNNFESLVSNYGSAQDRSKSLNLNVF